MDRALIAIAALLFSTGGAAIKACDLGPWAISALRSGVAVPALLLMLPATRRGYDWRILLVALAYASTLILFVLSTRNTTSANAIFLQSTAPLYLLLLGPLLLDERIVPGDLGVVGVVGIGLALVVFGGDAATVIAPRPGLGNALGLASGFTWAFTLAGLRWLQRTAPDGEAPAAKAAVVGNVFACLACLPMALPIPAMTAVDWMSISWLGVVQIGLAYALLSRGIGGVTALDASLLVLVEPLVNPVWAWWLQGEAPSVLALVGGGLIVVGTAAKGALDARMTTQRRSTSPPA